MNPLILNNLPNILGFIAITLFVFILIRELLCWYFKINERVQLLSDIKLELQRSNKYLSQAEIYRL